MTAPNGGRWLFSVGSGFNGVAFSFNDGATISPPPVSGAFNIEVFTNSSVDAVTPFDTGIDIPGQFGDVTPVIISVPVPVPPPDAGFQAAIADVGGKLDGGFLTGTNLRLGGGDFLVIDSVTGTPGQSPSKITLGTGKQTVVGAKSDTLAGGSGEQVLSGLVGNQTVIGGTGNESIWGGAGVSITGSNGSDLRGTPVNRSQQIVVTGAQSTIEPGASGNATISAAAQDTIRASFTSTQNLVIAAGQNNFIDLSLSNGFVAIVGAVGDTIATSAGSTTNIEGAAGGMLITIGQSGLTNLSGSTGPSGNTVSGGNGNFDFNPGLVAGRGDLINLSGNGFTATINAFSNQGNRIAAPDTILATNNTDSVFGGDGDRIGTGSGSVVGGTHQWVHADTLAGSAVGFGSNDTVSSTAYDTIGHTATRGTVPGTSSAHVTVGGFNPATDFLFYQNENTAATAAIIATSQAAAVSGTPSTVITLPDGTVMTLVGIAQAQLTPALFKP